MKLKPAALVLFPLFTARIASADVIVFENDNPDLTDVRAGFFYDPAIYYRPPEGLCVYLPASSQPVADVSTPGCVGFISQEAASSFSPWKFFVEPEGMNAVARADETVVLFHQGPHTYEVPEAAVPGASYSASSDWVVFGTKLFLGIYSPGSPGTHSWAVDEVFTIGVRFELDSGTHYGFATFERRPRPQDWEPIYYPVRWGYESEPDTAVVIPAAPCPADLAAPFGTLDFFDVSAFLSAFNTQDAAADLAEPFGSFDFFDVSAFLAAFNAGCP